MKIFIQIQVLAAAALLIANTGFALERDQIRGELVYLDRDMRSVEVRVLEAGDAVPTRIGRTEVYEIDDSTEIEFDLDNSRSVLRSRHLEGFKDLEPGQEVVMDFRLLGDRRMATVIYSGPVLFTRRDAQSSANANADSNSNPQYMAQNTQRSRLPDTASPIYTLAMLGLGFGFFAVVLRRKRGTNKR